MITLTYPINVNIAANAIPSLHSLLLEKIPTDLTKRHIAGGAIELLVISPGYQECPQKITFCYKPGEGIELLVKKSGHFFELRKDLTFCSNPGRGIKPKVIFSAHFSGLEFYTAKITKGQNPIESIILLVIIVRHFSPSFIKRRSNFVRC
jgi:hypothetical protein